MPAWKNLLNLKESAMQQYRYTDIPQTNKNTVGRYAHDQRETLPIDSGLAADAPAHGSYGGLLFDPRWKSKRAEIMVRDNQCCVICEGKDELLVHHRQYHFIKTANAFKVPWDYPAALLITLCKSCHQRGHSKFKVPILYI
jgi:5-methylcytosine-specific restriction endonuclease McrA